MSIARLHLWVRLNDKTLDKTFLFLIFLGFAANMLRINIVSLNTHFSLERYRTLVATLNGVTLYQWGLEYADNISCREVRPFQKGV